MTRNDIGRNVLGALIVFGFIIGGAWLIHPYAAIAAAVLMSVIAFDWLRRVWTVHELDKSTRGRELKTAKEARRICDERRKELNNDRGVLWGTVRIPTRDATNHFCVAGAVGSGKTLTIRMLMRDQLPLITEGSNRRALIYDAKQDMVPIVGALELTCPVIVLNPFDKRSYAWHMALDITSPAAARQLAVTLVPDTKSEAQPFFSNAVRELLVAVVIVFLKTRPGEWTFRELLLVMKSRDLLQRVLGQHEFTQNTVQNFIECNDVTLGSIMATVVTKLGPYEAIAAAWEQAPQKISIRHWLQNEYVIILGNDERVRSTLETVNQLFIAIVAQHALTMPDSVDRLTWLFYDEFREAGKLPGLENLILRGRSKGCCVVLGFQDLQGVQHVYDEKLGNELVGQCGNKAFLRIESPVTAEWASKSIGEKESYEFSESWSASGQGESRSASAQRQLRAQILPSEFMELPPPVNGLHGIYLLRSVGAFRAHYSKAELAENLGRVDSQALAFEEAEADWQYLAGWTEADDVRLGIRIPTVKTEKTTEMEPSPPRTEKRPGKAIVVEPSPKKPEKAPEVETRPRTEKKPPPPGLGDIGRMKR